MNYEVAKTLGVTIAFTLGATLISVGAIAMSLGGLDLGLTASIENFPQAVGIFVANSAFAGLIVDGVRLALDRCWPEQLSSTSRLKRS